MPTTIDEGSAESSRPVDTGALVRVLAILGAIAMVAGVALWNVNRYVAGDGLVLMVVRHAGNLLDPGREANLLTWYSSLLLAGVGLCLLVHALTLRGRYGEGSRSRPSLVLGGVALFMSADEAAELHEKLGAAASALGVALPWTFGWLVLGLPLAVVAAVLIAWVARGLDVVLRRRLFVAGFLFLLGAVGFEMVGGLVNRAFGDISAPLPALLYQAAEAVEEALEIAGALVALWATLSALEVRVGGDGLSIRPRPQGGVGRS